MPGCADCRPDRLRESRRVERAPVFGRIRRGRGVATAGLHRTHHCDRPPNRGRGLVSSAGVESIRAETAEFHGKPHLLPFMDTRSSSRPHPGAARMALDPVGAGRRSFTGNVAVPRSVDQMVRPPPHAPMRQVPCWCANTARFGFALPLVSRETRPWAKPDAWPLGSSHQYP